MYWINVLVFFFLCTSITFGQSVNSSIEVLPEYWKHKNTISIHFNQAAFGNHWKGGGTNAIAMGINLNVEKDYAKDKSSWENRFIFRYGIIKLGENEFQKNNDHFEIDSKYGYNLNKRFLVRSIFNFNTRVHDTYELSKTGERGKLIGNFMAPGYFNLSTGIDYVFPEKTLAIYYTPINSKVTIVADESLTNQFLPKDYVGQVRYELGSLVRIEVKKEIFTNVVLQTKGNFFTNYQVNFGNIDIDFQNKLEFVINKNLSANLMAHLIYDDDILFDIEAEDGSLYQAPRTQFQEVFNIGFSSSF